jgi:hypothetical protein
MTGYELVSGFRMRLRPVLVATGRLLPLGLVAFGADFRALNENSSVYAYGHFATFRARYRHSKNAEVHLPARHSSLHTRPPPPNGPPAHMVAP